MKEKLLYLIIGALIMVVIFGILNFNTRLKNLEIFANNLIRQSQARNIVQTQPANP